MSDTKPEDLIHAEELFYFLLWTTVEPRILITFSQKIGIIATSLVHLCLRSTLLAVKSFLNPLIELESVKILS
ncbi:hypothetical protein LCGC14_0949300 [marine sediment metagenome]|uniref:Uncharacterized protein n=1 Tax=marine sediment metagenome TaxID=412755 RepID=A0A0F9P3W7_9ZZZZ